MKEWKKPWNSSAYSVFVIYLLPPAQMNKVMMQKLKTKAGWSEETQVQMENPLPLTSVRTSTDLPPLDRTVSVDMSLE